MPRLLVISSNYLSENPLDFGGIHVHRQLLKLRDQGWDIKVIVPQSRVYRYLKQVGHEYPYRSSRDGINIYRPGMIWFPQIEKFGTLQDRMYSRAVFREAERLLSTWKPDLIECDWITPCGYAGMRLAQNLGIQFVLKAHGEDVRRIKKADTHALKAHFRTIGDAASYIIPNGDGLREELVSTGLFELDKIVSIPVGVDTSVFHPVTTDERNQVRSELGLNTDDKVWLFVGRWEIEKGSRELAQAALELLPTAPRTRLILVGPILDQETHSDLSILGDKVHFIGKLTTPDVARLMQATDLFVLPSYKEGLPSALLEAMASRLPPVVSAVGGIPNIIQSGVNGLLLEPRNTDDLITALRIHLDNPLAYYSLGKQAQQTIMQQGFSLDQVGQQLNRYLTACLPKSL